MDTRSDSSSATPQAAILDIREEAPSQTWITRHLGRKFVGFCTATGLLIAGAISPEDWKLAFTVYCAADVIEKLGLSFAAGKKGS